MAVLFLSQVEERKKKMWYQELVVPSLVFHVTLIKNNISGSISTLPLRDSFHSLFSKTKGYWLNN